jgi:hypothetical protein
MFFPSWTHHGTKSWKLMEHLPKSKDGRAKDGRASEQPRPLSAERGPTQIFMIELIGENGCGENLQTSSRISGSL